MPPYSLHSNNVAAAKNGYCALLCYGCAFRIAMLGDNESRGKETQAKHGYSCSDKESH